MYTCNGKESFFSPEFFYFGFRYALVEGMEHVEPADFEGVAVYSRQEFTGTFSCSNEKINQFYQNTIWSLKSNFVDIPTDCPQRDERLGWTGDGQVFAYTGALNANISNFLYTFFSNISKSTRGL